MKNSSIHGNLETVTDVMHLTCDSFSKVEIAKASNGMLFKLYGDVHYGGSHWNIFVWSMMLCQWNQLASKDSIPGIEHFDYFMSYAAGSQTNPNPIAATNFRHMKEFIVKFINSLPETKSVE